MDKKQGKIMTIYEHVMNRLSRLAPNELLSRIESVLVNIIRRNKV